MDDNSTSYEPMDIDQSMNSVKSLDNSSTEERPADPVIFPQVQVKLEPVDNEDTAVPTSNTVKLTKKPYRRFHVNKRAPEKRSFFKTNFVVMFSITVSILSVFIYFVMNVRCIEDLQIDKIHDTLSKKLFGQQQTVNKIVKTLNVSEPRKVLFFYGGTGVGKTYAASLILGDIWAYTNLYHFTMPSFKDTFSSSLMTGLMFCKSAVMVVDNLSHSDMDIFRQINEVIEKAEHLQRNIIIILIYNCETVSDGFRKKCDDHFVDELREKFVQIKAVKEFVKFESLSEDDLRKCIVAESGGQYISELKMRSILKNFDVTSDGCKGVHMKIQFMNVL